MTTDASTAPGISTESPTGPSDATAQDAEAVDSIADIDIDSAGDDEFESDDNEGDFF